MHGDWPPHRRARPDVQGAFRRADATSSTRPVGERQPNCMPLSMLRVLAGTLTPRVAAIGFVLVEEADFEELGWLEYEVGSMDALRRLSVTYRASDRSVHVELWRPGDLARATSGDEAERVTDQQTWQYTDDVVAPHALAHEIADLVIQWTEPRRPPRGQT